MRRGKLEPRGFLLFTVRSRIDQANGPAWAAIKDWKGIEMTNIDKNPARDLARAMPPAPTPQQIKQARSAAGQTQQQAAALVYVDGRAWRRWESGDRQMDAAHWELYQIKVIG